MNQWTTPDAYAGDVHDPMNQKPYMWNDNNPVTYSDPSGYCVEDLCVGEGVALYEVLTAFAQAATIEALFSRRGGKTSPAQRERIIQSKGSGCSYCGRQTDPDHDPKNKTSLEIDHDVSHKNGGSNGDDNKVPSCRECNNQKGPMNGDEYRAKYPQGSQTDPGNLQPQPQPAPKPQSATPQ